MTNRPIYHLSLSMRGCVARVELNGFPVVSVDARYPVSVAPPINAFLVGTGNELLIEALPTAVPGGYSTPEAAHISGTIDAFQEGDIVAPEGGGLLVQRVDLQRAVQGQALQFPLRATYRFDNEGPRFRERLLQADVITDAARLVDYAMHIRELARHSDAAGLAAEFSPKLRDYAAAYYDSEAAMTNEFLAFLQGTMFPGPMDLDFERWNVMPVSRCGGRIWELKRSPDRPLLSTMPNERGGRFQIPVYVGLVNGELKVVR